MSAEPLIHIGLHKTGSTWLQRGLFNQRTHGFTQVWPRTIVDDAFLGGNPYAFDPQRALSLVKPFLDQAAATSTVPVISHEPLSGNLLLNGYDSRTIADRIHETFPDARILLVIREQRSMMASMYKQYVRNSGTRRVDHVWREYTPAERRRPTPGLEVFEYHRLIDFYQRLFGTDRVLVLPYELLRDDVERFAAEICTFVGLSPPGHLADEREHEGMPGLLAAVVRLANGVLHALDVVEPFGGPVTNARLRDVRMRAINWLAPKIPRRISAPFDRRLAEAVARIQGDRFAESNRITASLTGLDLAACGYVTAAG